MKKAYIISLIMAYPLLSGCTKEPQIAKPYTVEFRVKAMPGVLVAVQVNANGSYLRDTIISGEWKHTDTVYGMPCGSKPVFEGLSMSARPVDQCDYVSEVTAIIIIEGDTITNTGRNKDGGGWLRINSKCDNYEKPIRSL